MKLNKKTVISLIPKAVLLILLLVIINTQLTESVVTGTFEKGLVFSILALGIFISFRILDIPDLSVDGTFTLGVAVSVMQAFNGDPQGHTAVNSCRSYRRKRDGNTYHKTQRSAYTCRNNHNDGSLLHKPENHGQT